MKKTLLLLFMLSSAYIVQAQVAINATGANPDVSAGLDVSFTNKGLLIPRVALTATTDATTIATPAYSTLVYNLGTGGLSPAGYYYNAGTSVVPNWVRFMIAKEAWMITGNDNTTPSAASYGSTVTNNFIGTTNANDFVFAANNYEKMRIKTDAAGTTVRIGIGTAYATAYPSGLTSTLLHVYDAESGANDFAQIQLGTNKNTATNKVGEINFHATTAATDRRTSSIESYITAMNGLNPSGDLRFFTNNSATATFTEKMRIQGDGNVGINTTAPATKLQVVGKTTISRDGSIECCGNDATLALADNPATTGRASISFHNSGESEGTFRLIQNSVNGVNSRRFQMLDNQGIYMGLELSGRLWYGNGNSRTETRDDAGLQGNLGAQSGFFETSAPAPASNWPTGAGSWWHLIDTRHSNSGNNFALQIAGSFFNQDLYYRKTNNNPAQPWRLVVATANAGTSGQILVSQGAGNPPVWQSANSVIKTYSTYATRTYISGTAWIQVTGLTKTITTPGPATLVIYTYGSIEIDSWDGNSGCEIKLQKDGVDVPNAFQTIDVVDNEYVYGTIGLWSFQTVVNIAAAGTYTFTIFAHEYDSSFDNFYAGGNTTAPVASQNQGSLIIMEYGQ